MQAFAGKVRRIFSVPVIQEGCLRRWERHQIAVSHRHQGTQLACVWALLPECKVACNKPAIGVEPCSVLSSGSSSCSATSICSLPPGPECAGKGAALGEHNLQRFRIHCFGLDGCIEFNCWT